MKLRDTALLVLLACFFVGALSVNRAFAKAGEQEIDLGGVWGSAPEIGGLVGNVKGVGVDVKVSDKPDSALGFKAGYGYEIRDNTQIRVDIIYLKFSKDGAKGTVGGEGVVFPATGTEKYTRTPVTLSARQYLPVRQFKAFRQFGLEVSRDKKEVSGTIPVGTLSTDGSAITLVPITVSASEEKTNVGVTPVVGMEYPVTRQISVGAEAAYHVIKDPYFTVGLVAAYHF